MLALHRAPPRVRWSGLHRREMRRSRQGHVCRHGSAADQLIAQALVANRDTAFSTWNMMWWIWVLISLSSAIRSLARVWGLDGAAGEGFAATGIPRVSISDEPPK